MKKKGEKMKFRSYKKVPPWFNFTIQLGQINKFHDLILAVMKKKNEKVFEKHLKEDIEKDINDAKIKEVVGELSNEEMEDMLSDLEVAMSETALKESVEECKDLWIHEFPKRLNELVFLNAYFLIESHFKKFKNSFKIKRDDEIERKEKCKIKKIMLYLKKAFPDKLSEDIPKWDEILEYKKLRDTLVHEQDEAEKRTKVILNETDVKNYLCTLEKFFVHLTERI